MKKMFYLVLGLTFVIILTSLSFNVLSQKILPDFVIGIYEKDFWKGFLVELHGLVFEFFVIVCLIGYFESRENAKSLIKKELEYIKDFAPHDEKIFNIQKVGSLKRLFLNGFDFSGLNINDLHINHTNFSEIALKNASLIGLKMAGCKVKKTDFFKLKIRSSNFSESYFKSVTFSECHLYNAKFDRAKLRDVKFIKNDMKGVSFKGADLQSCQFIDQNDLSGVDFENANLRSTNFKGQIGLTVEQVMKAKSLDFAVFDPEFSRSIDAYLSNQGKQRRKK